MLMARILGISQYLKIEVQPSFMRGRGTKNWKLNTGNSLFSHHPGAAWSLCFSLFAHFIFLSPHVVFYHCAWLNKFSNS